MKSRHIKSGSLIVLILLILVLTNCTRGEDSLPTFQDQGNIGSEGGIVKTSDGASLEIPAGTLKTSQIISITNITESDTVANSGCRIYELKPDGLVFSDSITITLPFEKTYIDLNSSEKNYGIMMMVFQDGQWSVLKSKIDFENGTIQAKTIHFSFYSTAYRSGLADYFKNNRNSTTSCLNVPYYCQGSSNWCYFNSLSMATRYAGYTFHAPFIAALMKRSTNEGVNYYDEKDILEPELKRLLIGAEFSKPQWYIMENLCGYVMKMLNHGNPVVVRCPSINHGIIVVGHNTTGFYINDPGGAFTAKVYNNLGLRQGLIEIPYEKFIEVLEIGSGFLDPPAASTAVITSEILPNYKFAGSLNFLPGSDNLLILGADGISNVGKLIFNGNLHTNGYYFWIPGRPVNVADGTNFMKITPVISNNDKNDLNASLHFLIDNNEVSGSPIRLNPIIGINNYVSVNPFTFQLKNLNKGAHTLYVKLVSTNNPNQYDSWEFPFTIENEYYPPTIIDNDGNTYNTVTIGSQTWMGENLKTTKYNDGSAIPNLSIATQWKSTTGGAYCWYNNNETAYKETYGALYNWYAVNTNKLCPSGWHVPTDSDWKLLEMYLGMSQGIVGTINWRGTNEGGKLKEAGYSHWVSPNSEANNISGFAGLPAGIRWQIPSDYSGIGNGGVWWTSTELYAGTAWYRGLYWDRGTICRSDDPKWYGFSVRCVKD